jgi:hypothetical protein
MIKAYVFEIEKDKNSDAVITKIQICPDVFTFHRLEASLFPFQN